MIDITTEIKDEYNKMTDENLLKEAVSNQNNIALDCLIGRYKDVVSMKANKFFMIGSEREDILQEGYIGLYKAVKSFDAEKQRLTFPIRGMDTSTEYGVQIRRIVMALWIETRIL